MSNEYSRQSGDQDIRRESVTRTRGGFTVPASPLNVVKLDLGVILCVALLVWLMVEYLSDRVVVQLTVLALYGVLAMAWLLLRTRRIERQLLASHRTQGSASIAAQGGAHDDGC